MPVTYGAPLPPGVDAPTKGEIRIRIDKLILNDETINHNPFFPSASESLYNERHQEVRTPNRFLIPVDHCAVAPLFWGESKPSAVVVPSTPKEARGSFTLVYPVKVSQEEFGAYLEQMTRSPHHGVQLEVYVPSSFSGRNPIPVGKAIVNVEDLEPRRSVNGWFSVGTVVPAYHQMREGEKSSASTILGVGQIKLSFTIVFFSRPPRELSERKSSNQNVHSRANGSSGGHSSSSLQQNSVVSGVSSTSVAAQRYEEERGALKANDHRQISLGSANDLTNGDAPTSTETEEKDTTNALPTPSMQMRAMAEADTEARVIQQTVTASGGLKSGGGPAASATTPLSRRSATSAIPDKVAAGASVTNTTSSSGCHPTSGSGSSNRKSSSVLDSILEKGKALQERMAEAVATTSISNGEAFSRGATSQRSGRSTSLSGHRSSLGKGGGGVPDASLLTLDIISRPENGAGRQGDSNEDGGSSGENSTLYTSQDSDDERFTIQLKKDVRARRKMQVIEGENADEVMEGAQATASQSPILQEQNVHDNEASHSFSWHDEPAAVVSPLLTSDAPSRLRKRSSRCTTVVEMEFSNLSFARTPMTADIEEIRINICLSRDITTDLPAAGPFSSFVHPIPLSQPRICLSFPIHSFSEEHSRLVVEFFKVRSRPVLPPGTTLLPSNPKLPREVVAEIPLGLCIVGVFKQERVIAIQDPIQDVVNACAHLVLRLTPVPHSAKDGDTRGAPDPSHQPGGAVELWNDNTKCYSSPDGREGGVVSRPRGSSFYLNAAGQKADADNLDGRLHSSSTVQQLPSGGRYSSPQDRSSVAPGGTGERGARMAFRSETGAFGEYHHAPPYTDPENDRLRALPPHRSSMTSRTDAPTSATSNIQSGGNPSSIRFAEAPRFSRDYSRLEEGDCGVSSVAKRSGHASFVNVSAVDSSNTLQFPGVAPNSSGPHSLRGRCRFHVAILDAKQIPLVAVTERTDDKGGKATVATASISGQEQLAAGVHSVVSPGGAMVLMDSFKNRFQVPNTFFVVEEIYSGVDGSSASTGPVKEWLVEATSGGHFDRSSVVFGSVNPTYGFECIVSIPEESVLLTQSPPNTDGGPRERRNGATLYDNKRVSPLPARPCLRELQLTMWHLLDHADTSFHPRAEGQSEEEFFWSNAAYIGECRIDLRPLKHLPSLQGYYRVTATGGSPLQHPPKVPTLSSKCVGYAHVAVSLLAPGDGEAEARENQNIAEDG